MNNFAEDEFTEKDSNPDLDLNKTSDGTGDAELNEEFEGTPAGKGTITRIIRALVGIFVIGFATATYWNMMPTMFNVEQVSTTTALTSGHRAEGEVLPNGYRFVTTLIYIMEEKILGKPGGLMSNDWIPISRLSDNMRSWERGAMAQYRIAVHGLRFDLSRMGPQSQEHEQLRKAEPLFQFQETSLVLPSSEAQYKQGLSFLKDYRDTMSEPDAQAKFFTARQDQVINFLDRQKQMLGSYAAKLQQNVGATTYSTNVYTSQESEAADLQAQANSSNRIEDNELNGFFERDNAFYEVRGGVYVLYHCMLALRTDGEKLIDNAQAMSAMNRIVNELESACQPMGSPMVLNGDEFGVLQNHSLVMASHIAKTHLAIVELQQQLRGGGQP